MTVNLKNIINNLIKKRGKVTFLKKVILKWCEVPEEKNLKREKQEKSESKTVCHSLSDGQLRLIKL